METILTLGEVAELLRVKPATIYRLLRKRIIPAFKMGKEWRFTQESVDLWMKKHSVMRVRA
jgi:excisionase family DNA binding protein